MESVGVNGMIRMYEITFVLNAMKAYPSWGIKFLMSRKFYNSLTKTKLCKAGASQPG